MFLQVQPQQPTNTSAVILMRNILANHPKIAIKESCLLVHVFRSGAPSVVTINKQATADLILK